jgi:prepilin signal peptidase PulO-like enzyme (type II secretory pathway)
MGYRIPNKVSTYKKGSFCPKCNKKLKWYMNIPLISYIIQKGKCAYCKEKIGLEYPLCELITAILFLISYLFLKEDLKLYTALIIVSALMVTAISDFKYYYVSDRVIIISILLILSLICRYNGLYSMAYFALYGLVMMGVMYLIKLFGNFLFKKESMGTGDIKLMALVGVSVGIINSFITIFIASILAIIYVIINKKFKPNEIVPFAPFILFSCLLTIYFSKYIDIFMNFLFF